MDSINSNYKKSGGNKQVEMRSCFYLLLFSTIIYLKVHESYLFICHKKIFDEKFEVDAQPKVDAFNPNYKKSGGNVHIVNDRVIFDAEPKVDHVNYEYKRGGGNKQVKIIVRDQ